MGYNRDDLIRIKTEYREKYQKARSDADMRAEKIYMEIPRVKAIDAALSRTVLEIMSAVTGGNENAEEALARVRARNVELMEERGKLLFVFRLFDHGGGKAVNDAEQDRRHHADHGQNDRALHKRECFLFHHLAPLFFAPSGRAFVHFSI